MSKEANMSKVAAIIQNEMDNIDIEALKKQRYQEALADETDLKNWFEDIRCLRDVFVIPDTHFFTLSQEWFNWLRNDSYSEDDIQRLSNEIVTHTPSYFFEKSELFLKTGMFSDKFTFKNCHLKKKNYKDIGRNFLSIFYDSMMVGCPESPIVVIREFIRTSVNRPTIYDGMKLNTEARLFYDFDKKQVLDVFNYWDRETMLENLWDADDKETFRRVIDEIEADFNAKKQMLIDLAEQKLKDVPNLVGKWSVDFMFIDNEQFALIDMAPAHKSYYAEKLKS